jgi:hypothetical protein
MDADCKPEFSTFFHFIKAPYMLMPNIREWIMGSRGNEQIANNK